MNSNDLYKFKVKNSPNPNSKFLLMLRVRVSESTGYPEDPYIWKEYNEAFEFSSQDEPMFKEIIKDLYRKNETFYITKYSPVNASIEINIQL